MGNEQHFAQQGSDFSLNASNLQRGKNT